MTTTFPVVAPAGTWAVILTELQAVGAMDPADTPLKVTVLVPCADPKLAPETRTNVPTGPLDGLTLVMLGGGGITANVTPLLATPLRVTTTAPVVAAVGTVTVILVSPQFVAVAMEPLKVTVLVPCVDPKLLPVMVTAVFEAPDVGFKVVMAGGGMTVKVNPLLVPLLVVTTTGPLVAPLGMKATMLPSLQLVTPRPAPLSIRVLPPCPGPKFFPDIVTDVPNSPDVGLRPVMTGAGKAKFTPLLTAPPILTVTTLLIVTPEGTGTTMLVALQLVTGATKPLNVTDPFACAGPKFVPVIVIGVPTDPDVGLTLVIVIGGTAKFTALLVVPPTVTVTGPVVAPVGTATVIVVLFQFA